MSSKQPSGKRRGRKPKEVKHATSEIPGMFVLPPDILQKLGINLNESVQHAQASSSALPVNVAQEGDLSFGTNIASNLAKNIQTKEVGTARKKTGDSSILETANLMKSSLFLSPTFIPPVTSININGEIEFLSLNQNETNAEEKPVSDESLVITVHDNIDGNHKPTDSSGVVETKTNNKGKWKQGQTASPEKEASLDIHAEVIENLRKRIQKTIEHVMENSEEVNVDLVTPESGASVDTVVPTLVGYAIQEDSRNINDNLDTGNVNDDVVIHKNVESNDTVIPITGFADFIVPENLVRDLNDNSEIVDTLKSYETSFVETKVDENLKVMHIDNIGATVYVKEPFPAYLDNKTIGRSPEIIEALLELNQAEELLSDEMNLKHVEKGNIVDAGCIFNKDSEKHSLNNDTVIQFSVEEKRESQALEVDKKENVLCNMNPNRDTANNFSKQSDTQTNENLRKAIANEILSNSEKVLPDENRDCSVLDISESNKSQKKFDNNLQGTKPKVNNGLEIDKPAVIAAKANMLLDDRDKAYLSDYSNSNLGASGSTEPAQEIFEPRSKQGPKLDHSSDIKNSKISILSEEIIEPSRFNHILERAKKCHQKDNFIPVSINTVVSLNYKNTSPDYTKTAHNDLKMENNSEEIISTETNSFDNNPIVIEFVDEFEHYLENAEQINPATSDKIVSQPKVVSEKFEEEANKKNPQKKSVDEISDIANLSSNNNESHKDHEGKDANSEEKVEVIASYLAKFAHLLAHRKENTINVSRKKPRNIMKSKLRKEGVEKLGGADKSDESQDEDECGSHVWRTYRISQKMPRSLNNNWDFHKAITITTEDKISLQESTEIHDIKVDFSLCGDFGSMCYYDSAVDLFEYFQSHDSNKISLEELFHESLSSVDGKLYSAEDILDEGCSNMSNAVVEKSSVPTKDVDCELTNKDSNGHLLYEKLAQYQTKKVLKEEPGIESKDACEHHYIDEHLANDGSRSLTAHESTEEKPFVEDIHSLIEENLVIEADKGKKMRMSIFEAMEKDVNNIMINASNYLKKRELVFSDDNYSASREVREHSDFDKVSLGNVEPVVAYGGQLESKDKPNESSKVTLRGNKYAEKIEAARGMSTVTMKRGHSAAINDLSDNQAAPSAKKNIKCGVCQKKISGTQWSVHVTDYHCCIAWKAGEAINLKSNALLSDLNSRLKTSPPLKCTFCKAEYNTCKKFLSHVRKCLGNFEKRETVVERCVCAVCSELVDSEKWFQHIKTRHHYIAWREGDTPIKQKKGVNRHLESVLKLHGYLKCSECDFGCKDVDSFTVHIKTCDKNSSDDREEIVRRQSSASESDMKISDLKQLKKTARNSNFSSVSRSLQNSLVLPEPSAEKSDRRSSSKNSDSVNRDGKITDFYAPKPSKNKLTHSVASNEVNGIDQLENYTIEGSSGNRLSRNSATKETQKRSEKDGKEIAKVSEIEPVTFNFEDLKKSEDHESLSSNINSTVSSRNTLKRKRNRLVSTEEALPSSHNTEDDIISNEESEKNSRRSRSSKTPKISKEDKLKTVISGAGMKSDESDEPNQSNVTPRSERKSTQDKQTYPEDTHSNDFYIDRTKNQKHNPNVKPDDPTTVVTDTHTKNTISSEPRMSNRSSAISTNNKRKSSEEKRIHHKDKDLLDFQTSRSNTKRDDKYVRPSNSTTVTVSDTDIENTTARERNFEISTGNVSQTSSSRSQLEDSILKDQPTDSQGLRGQGNKPQDACEKSELDQFPLQIKSEQVIAGNCVECGVCQEKVESKYWMTHSQMKHQYLAWQTGEKAFNAEDDYDALEHLRNLMKTLDSLVCSKCGLTRKYPKKFLSHIRSCEVTGNETVVPNQIIKHENEKKSSDILTKNKIVTCAICNEDVKSVEWQDHSLDQHYNLAWPIGGIPIDRRNTWHVEKALKAYKLARKTFTCKVCGISRVSCLGFYAHILVCGKTEEESEEFKDTCGVCNQKYLCIYRQQHYAFHAQQEKVKELKAFKFECKEKLERERIALDETGTLGTPGGKRKAAEKARHVLENFAKNKSQFLHQCRKCDFGADTRLELDSHKCGGAFSDSDESVQLKSEDESADSVVDSDVSDEELGETDERPCSKRKKTAEYRAKLSEVPFKVRDVKKYLKRGYKDFCDLHFTSDRLFTDWIPNCEMIPDSLIKPYLPQLEESCKLRNEDGWNTFKRFEARFENVVTFFVGAVPQCMSWAPPRHHPAGEDLTGNFLAVACSQGPDMPRLNFDRTYKYEGLLQIWDFGEFDVTLPHFALGIAHDYGAVWAMDWCPSGARDTLPPVAGQARLGLLAVACSDGAAYIFPVPYPSTLPERDNVIYKLKPVVELRFDDQKQFQCTTIKWSSQKGHATIAAGYSDGSVAFYNLNGGSPLGQSEEDGVWILYPYHDERAQSTCLVGVDLFPSTEAVPGAGLACAASCTGLSMWAERGATLARTALRAACAGALFQPLWPSVLTMGHEPLVMSEVEWSGFRGRAGAPRLAAVSACSGLLVGTYPPLLRASLPHRLLRDTPRNKLALIEMMPLSGNKRNEKENNEFEMKLEPLTYEKAAAAYGLQLTLITNHRARWSNMNESRPERFPLSDVTAMGFCQHPNFQTKLAVGTHSGLLFILSASTRNMFPEPK